MSGPTTLGFLLVQGTILGTIAVLRSARAVGEGLGEANSAAAQTLQLRDESARSLRQRERAARHGLDRRIDMLEAGLQRLMALRETLQPTLAEAGGDLVIEAPAAPAEREPARLEAYAAQLEAALSQAQAVLATAGARIAADSAAIDAAVLDRLARPRSLSDLLSAYAEAGAQDRAGAMRATRMAQVDKLVAPLAADAAVSPQIEALVRELAGTPDPARADALVLELRLALGAERTRREAEAGQRASAEQLLAELDAFDLEADATTAPLRQSLELAAAGLAPLDAGLQARARSLLDALGADLARATGAAASQILESTLRDLGFVVEPIAETLFVEGGVTHFTRPGWGDYAVRLRASTAEATLNFNVVREAKAAAGVVDALSTRLNDARAEEAWCAHIPKLQETLDARGVKLKVLRRLGAGEAPAQVVAAGTLSGLTEAEAPVAGRAAPLQQSSE